MKITELYGKQFRYKNEGTIYTINKRSNNTVFVTWVNGGQLYDNNEALGLVKYGDWILENLIQHDDFNEYIHPPLGVHKEIIVKDAEIVTPNHYNNENGTLYKVANQRNWNPYLFDIVKRLERADKKGEFESDLNKSIAVIQLWLKESKNEK